PAICNCEDRIPVSTRASKRDTAALRRLRSLAEDAPGPCPRRSPSMSRRTLPLRGFAVTFLFLFAAAFGSAAPKPKVDPQLASRYQALSDSIDPSSLHETIKTLSSYPSRVVGYQGTDEAAKYVKQKFVEAGLADVHEEPLIGGVTVPMV